MDEFKDSQLDKKLNKMFFRTFEEGKYPDLSKTRNYL